jgi:hypothetical protein
MQRSSENFARIFLKGRYLPDNGCGVSMESVLFLLLAAVPVLVVVLTAGAMWLYPEIDLSVRLAGARFELHGWRPSMRTERRRAKPK